MDYYSILGVSRTAGQDEIKKAYRKLAVKWHPDKNGGDQSAETKFKEISDAYSTLSDTSKKSQYDAKLNNSNRTRNNQSDFGFNDFIKNQFRQNSGFKKGPSFSNRPNSEPINETEYLNISLTRQVSLKDALVGIKLTIPVNRTRVDSSKGQLISEEKEIVIDINLSNFYFNIKFESDTPIINTRVAGLGNEDFVNIWSYEHNGFGKTIIRGDLHIKILIDIPEDIKLDGLDVIQFVKIPLSKAIFNGEKILIETIIDKKYNAEISNPTSLSDLKFILKDKGIMGTDRKMGKYIIKFDIIPPNISKLSKSDISELQSILSQIE